MVYSGYLVNLYQQKDIIDQHPVLKEYIETNLKPFIVTRGDNSLIPDPLCEKHSYVDETEAKKALKLIKQDKRKHKKPDRAYHCEICGYWHLTSKPLI